MKSDEIDLYIDHLARTGRRSTTLATYRSNLERILDILAEDGRPTRASLICEDDIYYIRSAYHIKEASVHAQLMVLDGMIEWLTGHAVVRPMKMLWNRVQRDRCFISAEDLGRMYRIADPPLRLSLLLGAMMGLRRTEILSLTLDDLDGARLLVRGKGHGPEGMVWRQPMTPEVQRELDSYLPWRASLGLPAEDRRLVVLMLPSGRPTSTEVAKSMLSEQVADLGKAVGTDATVHSLRRLYATTIYRGGTDLLTMRDLMRHASSETTLKCYIEADTSKRDAALSGVSSALGSAISLL